MDTRRKPVLPEHYAILSLNPSCTPTEIKIAYRRRAMELHPDKNPENPKATARFQKLQEAHEILEYWHSQQKDAESQGTKTEPETQKKHDGAKQSRRGKKRETKRKEQEQEPESEYTEHADGWTQRRGVKGKWRKAYLGEWVTGKVGGQYWEYVPTNCRGRCRGGLCEQDAGCILGERVDGKKVDGKKAIQGDGGKVLKGDGKKALKGNGKTAIEPQGPARFYKDT